MSPFLAKVQMLVYCITWLLISPGITTAQSSTFNGLFGGTFGLTLPENGSFTAMAWIEWDTARCDNQGSPYDPGIQFNSTISGGVSPYNETWSFGDGSSPGYGPAPHHNYPSFITIYNVSMHVRDWGDRSTWSNLTASVSPPPCPPVISSDNSPLLLVVVLSAVAVVFVLLRARIAHRRQPPPMT